MARRPVTIPRPVAAGGTSWPGVRVARRGHGGARAGTAAAPVQVEPAGGGLAAHLLQGPAASTRGRARPLPKNDPRDPFWGPPFEGGWDAAWWLGLNPEVWGYLGFVPL